MAVFPSKILVKKRLASALDHYGITAKILVKKRHTDVLILMYHRILKTDEMPPVIEGGMYVNSETFKEHIEFLTNSFQIISLEKLSRLLKNGQYSKEIDKPICVLTFDDGWKDFYVNAYPILKKYGALATVFLATGFVGTNDTFWTEKLARLLGERERRGEARRKHKNPSNAIADLLESSGGPAECRLERAILRMKAAPQKEIDQTLDRLCERWGVQPSRQERDFLTWEEAREMCRSGLVSFGSHTESHPILTMLRDDQINEELMRSKDRLVTEGVADSSNIPFAYPNGDYNEKITEAVKNHEYNLAVTTRKGWTRISVAASAFELTRIGVHQDVASSPSTFACRILGII